MGRLILLLMIVACIGCSPYRRDTTLFQSTGRQKAIVTVLPVINSAPADPQITWDLSREFTDEIRKRVFDSPRIYLLREEGNLEIAKQLNASDLSTLSTDMTKQLGAAEFVVISEVIRQTEAPHRMDDDSFNGYPGSILSVALRVRVIDTRQDTPRVILQEILNQDHVITRPYLNANYEKTPWGTEAFYRTPMGAVHIRLIGELIARVEGYIEAAR